MRRSTRVTKPPKLFDETEGYIQAPRPKKSKKIEAEPVETEPVETRPADDPPAPEVKEVLDQPPPIYSPPVQVRFTPLQVHWKEHSPIALFLKFLGNGSIAAIVEVTNARATYSIGPHPKYART